MGHLRLVTPIHKGIRSMIYDLGKELQTTDFADEQATEATFSKLNPDPSSASRINILSFIHEHHDHEEKAIFPEVQRFDPQLIDKLLQEHREVVKMMTNVWQLVSELKTIKTPEQRIAVGGTLNRSANDLFAFFLVHINNEEAKLEPAMLEHFTDEQLLAINTSIEKTIPEERKAQWMSWILPSLNVNELVGMFIGWKKSAPPLVFASIARTAETTLREDRWKMVKSKAGI